MQDIREKKSVYVALANMELRSLLKDGDTVNKPYRSDMYAQDYVKGTDISFQDISSTNEKLEVTTKKIIPFYVNICVFA